MKKAGIILDKEMNMPPPSETKMSTKIFICGYARHGKDYMAEVLRNLYGFKFDSSSMFAMKMVVREGLAVRHGLKYSSEAECYADRVNHRSKWFDLICEFNKEDPARLARLMFKENNIYVGIRNIIELNAAKAAGLADLVIWVDATERIGTIESKESNTITAEDCDFIITNNGTKEEFVQKVGRIFGKLHFYG